MTQLPKILDNERKSMFNIIDQLLPSYDEISIATGYWDLDGIGLIIDKLLNYKKIRLLLGREPLIPRHALNKPEDDFPEKDIFLDLENLGFREKYFNIAKKLKDLIEEGKLEIKIYKESFLHAKCYIFGNYNSDSAIGIVGSSNFTKAGLTGNTELNVLEDDHRIVTFCPRDESQEVGHLYWFDHFWNSEYAEDRNGKFLNLLNKSPVGGEIFTPYEMYIKTLYEMYKEELDTTVEISDDNKDRLMSYQVRNVNNLIRKLEKNKVAMLADSVGLGKTATAIEVIKQYKNNKDKNRGRRVEVIVPSSLEEQRKMEMAKFGLAEDFIPVTPFHNENRLKQRQQIDKYAPVNLFVIDESHNLRNMNSKRFSWIYKRIENNPNSHVLLLTATPINNQLNDLTNQILLGSKGNSNIAKVIYESSDGKSLKINNFQIAIKDIEAGIKRSIKKKADTSRNYERLKRVVREIIGKFIVRNTRRGVMADPDFKGKFPTAIPKNANYEFDESLTKKVIDVVKDFDDNNQILWFDTNDFIDPDRVKRALHPLVEISSIKQIENHDISGKSPIFFVYQLILLLGFIPYRWKLYDEKFYGKTFEEIFNQALNQKEQNEILSQLSIYGMLRVSYLKRLESSIYAIHQSVKRYKNLLETLKKSIEDKNQIVRFQKLDLVIDYLNGETLDDEELDEVNPYDIPEGFHKTEILKDIKRDILLSDTILKQLEILNQDDSKIKALAKTINEVSNNNINGGKVLVFSFFADTIDYLSNNIGRFCNCINGENSAFLSGTNKKEVQNLAGRFAPNSKQYILKEGETEIQFLFATDVLSEGQNLQDCGVIINYDLHRNPVRMIQRNGRINRLGCKYDNVFIYNMFPEKQLDQYLGLIRRLENKIEMINFSIGLDQPVLNDNYEAVEFVDDIKKLYAGNDPDIINKIEADTDILNTEDGFLQDLKEFDQNATYEEKERIYNKIPLGKWGSQPNENLPSNISLRPDVLISGKLFTKDNGSLEDSGLIMFATSDRDGNEYTRVESLVALQWLKCNRNSYHISNMSEIMKKVKCEDISKNASIRMIEKQSFAASNMERNLKPKEQDFIVSLINLGYGQEDRLPIREAFTKLDNSVREKKIRSLYTKAKSDITNIEKVKELIAYCKESMRVQSENLSKGSDIETIKAMFYSVGI